MIDITIFQTTAVCSKNHYIHFGISKDLAFIYGHKSDEVVELQMKISDNQNIPPSNDKGMDADYWGWFCFEKQKFTLIYPKRFLLNMCFAYGIDAEEQVNRGKAYRLELINKK